MPFLASLIGELTDRDTFAWPHPSVSVEFVTAVIISIFPGFLEAKKSSRRDTGYFELSRGVASR